MMVKAIFCVASAGLACVLTIPLLHPQAGSRSKSSQKELQAFAAARKVEAAKAEKLWQPVAEAMSSGDVRKTRAAVAAYVATGEQIGFARERLARFYLSKGDKADARAVLDRVVDPFDSLDARGEMKRARPLRAGDAEALTLWLDAAVDVPKAKKQAVLARWYANYDRYGMKKEFFDDYKLTPAALTEFLAGQCCLGGKEKYPDAVKHFRRALALAPTSLAVAKQLVLALRFNGNIPEARVVAVRAWKLSKDPREQQGILWGAHLTKAEAEKIVASGKP